MKLRNHVGGKRMDEMSEGNKSSDSKVIIKRENVLNRKFNLRSQDKSDSKKESSNKTSKKLSGRNIKTENIEVNCGVELDIEQKENKIKKRPKRSVSQNCLEIKSCALVSPFTSQEKITCTLGNSKKVKGIMSLNSNLRGEKCITRKKNIKYEKVNDKVPLCEISNDCPVMISGKKNRLLNKINDKSQCNIKHTEKSPIWKKKPNTNEVKCGIKRKSFVDVYDISQDEDMSNEAKQKKRKINLRKNVKKTINKNKCFTISNKNTNFYQKPAHHRLNKLIENLQSNNINSNPTVKVNATTLSSDKKLEVILSADIVEENDPNYVINTDDLDAASEHIEIDNTCTDAKSQNAKKFLLNLADELENSLLIPRMTSTPNTTLLNNTVTNHLPNCKLVGPNISSIVPKTKNVKIPVKIGKFFSNKGADITLFESPVKKSKEKHPVALKSSNKSMQINFNNFTEHSEIDDLESTVLEPKKAYHSPDNFKTHLARSKRISEVIKKDTKKSKEEMMIEKMTQHFEEISSTELCIE